ncbi:uncharacterized protein QYS62_010987 [Fusarium acuminatum]|uniref:Methyltransferase type 11 domain-containing protein n=1 Tax=Fusarium acuminatum TaxID=5515 RepID=A0ABZ2XD34_9HYPO
MARPELTEPDVGPSSKGDRLRNILRKPASNLALRITDLDRYRNMWEVSWAAPKESRKEHRDNKVASGPKASNNAIKARSLFSRGSSTSSETSSLGTFSRRKNVDESISPTVSSSSSKISATAFNYELESDRISTLSAGSEHTTVNVARIVDLSSRRKGHILDSSREIHAGDNTLLDPPSPTLTSSSTPWDTDSVERGLLLPWPLVQALSEDSFIARRTEATVTPRTSYDTPFLMNCGVTIEATPSIKSKGRAQPSSSPSVINPTHIDLPLTPNRTSQMQPQRPQSSRSATKAKTPRRMPSSTASLRVENLDSWKPPNAWNCTPTEPSFQFPDEHIEAPEPSIRRELNAMQLGVKQLARESNMVRLLRLIECQSDNGPPTDCQDLEVEKMQWMLSAMYNLDDPAYPDTNSDGSVFEPADPPKRLLALYETPAVTSYLAAVNHNKQLHHLSAAPLSHEAFPNIHPVLSPVRSPAAFPVAPSTIEAVHSLRLPLAMPSQDIPALLRNIHRCLEPGGSLHLTIIDPLPVTSTLGPLLRTWIDDHLLFNLESSFRCTNPSKLLPVWLKSASLRVDPNCIETTQFFSIPLHSSQLQYVRDGHVSEEGLTQELRNIVGRMLWMEIWREYIIAEQWWWEDPDILRECVEWKTTWEWRLIEAVKDT